MCGVYVLFNERTPVYIGQSVNILARLTDHVKTGKEFDFARFVECEREDLDQIEIFLIKLFKPALNGSASKSGPVPDLKGFPSYLVAGITDSLAEAKKGDYETGKTKP